MMLMLMMVPEVDGGTAITMREDGDGDDSTGDAGNGDGDDDAGNNDGNGDDVLNDHGVKGRCWRCCC